MMGLGTSILVLFGMIDFIVIASPFVMVMPFFSIACIVLGLSAHLFFTRMPNMELEKPYDSNFNLVEKNIDNIKDFKMNNGFVPVFMSLFYEKERVNESELIQKQEGVPSRYEAKSYEVLCLQVPDQFIVY